MWALRVTIEKHRNYGIMDINPLKDLLETNPNPSEDELRNVRCPMIGNIKLPDRAIMWIPIEGVEHSEDARDEAFVIAGQWAPGILKAVKEDDEPSSVQIELFWLLSEAIELLGLSAN